MHEVTAPLRFLFAFLALFLVATPALAQAASPSVTATPSVPATPSAEVEEEDAGPTLKVVDLAVRGNRAVSEETILLAVPIRRGEEVSRKQIIESLQRIYGLGYFMDVKASTEPIVGGERLVFHVVENPTLRGVEIAGATKFPEAELKQPFELMLGKIINLQDVQKLIKDIEKRYADEGYVLARVVDLKVRPGGVLHLELTEGKIHAIKIQGNQETQDYVIRRELTLKPGELFNLKRMEDDLRRVYNLNYFEDIGLKYEQPPEHPEQVNVVVTVKEKQTGSFQLSAGWSNRDGPLGIVGLRKDNLFGRAQSVSADLTLSRNWAAEVSYFNPWIDPEHTSFGGNLYMRRFANFFANINEERQGGMLSFGRPLFGDPVTSQWRGAVRLRAERIGVLQPQVPNDFSQLMPFPQGTVSGDGWDRAVSGGFTLTHDSRDYLLNPNRGWFNTLTVEQYVPGLGDLNFTRFQGDVNHYVPLWGGHTLAFGTKAGTLFSFTGQQVPPYERFFSTGAFLIRGWPENPTFDQQQNISFSGDSFMLASLEYRFPIYNIVSGVVFGDTGMFWDRGQANFDWDRTRSGYGVGLRLNTPLGPLRLDYGIHRWGEPGQIHFSIGQKF